MGDRLRAGIPSRAVTSQLDQLSLASLRGRLIEYQLRLGYRRECHLCRVCDPIWHVSSRCGEASCELLYSVYFILLYTSAGCRPPPTHSAAATAAARSPTLVLLFLSLVSVCVCMSVYLSVCLSVCRCFGMCPEISLSV